MVKLNGIKKKLLFCIPVLIVVLMIGHFGVAKEPGSGKDKAINSTITFEGKVIHAQTQSPLQFVRVDFEVRKFSPCGPSILSQPQFTTTDHHGKYLKTLNFEHEWYWPLYFIVSSLNSEVVLKYDPMFDQLPSHVKLDVPVYINIQEM